MAIEVAGRDPIVAEAIERFERANEWEAEARKRFLDDLKFAEGDAYNGYQWPGGIRQDREIDDKPVLTINKTRQHNLQIINDAKKNKPGIKVSATGGGATYQSAQVISAIIKHIEYRSNATAAYDRSVNFQVKGGIGYLRVRTDYVDQESFDQEILIEGVRDPLTVWLDPDAQQPDKSDANFGFIADLVPVDQFEIKYPKYKTLLKELTSSGQSILGQMPGWIKKDHIIVAEYLRKLKEWDKLYAIKQEDGEYKIVRKSLLSKAVDKDGLKEIEDDPEVLKRDVLTEKVEWFLIVGEKIVDRKDWPGKYIPIVPVIGEEVVIDGVLDWKGHTRALLDPQRMYNYWSSAAVEYGALQGKTPWLAPVESVEGYEAYYNTANRVNHAWLPYKSLDQNGQKLDKPERTQPPVAAPVALEGMKIAQVEMGLVSGQYEGTMGQPGNERTGAAISQRQRPGDTATYHFIDGLGVAVRQIGKIIVDLLPKIYDTRRVMQIISMDEQPIELIIDPQMKEAYEQRKNQEGVVVAHALNPAVGRYEVQVDIGPGYATQREAAFEAYKLILTQSPQLTQFIGDILFRAADFPHAEEAAQRLRRLVPSYALGEGPSPTEQQLQKQVEELTKLLAENMEELTKTSIKLKGKEQLRDIDVYGEFTKRLKVLLDSKLSAAKMVLEASKGEGEEGGSEEGDEAARQQTAITAEDINMAFGDLLPDLLGVELTPIIEANAPAHESAIPSFQTKIDDPRDIRRDFAGRPFGRDFSNSKAFRPI